MGPHWLLPEGAPINKTKGYAELEAVARIKGKARHLERAWGSASALKLANSARMVVSVRE
jgi:hypothetical protein